jgi:proteasome lid subunit RPN8/RPN11
MTSAGQDAVVRDAVAAARREPMPLNRSILWYPAGRGSRDTGMGKGGYPVFLDQSVLNAIRAHVEASPNDPLLGFLAGELSVDPDLEAQYLMVDGVFVCRYAIENDDPMPTFLRVWERLRDEVEGRHTQLVGWYRSYPRGDPSLSAPDVTAHGVHFPEPWQIAIAVRPDRMRPAGGLYRMTPAHGWASSPLSFYEMLEYQPRRSTGGKRTQLTWKNYHTNELVLAAEAPVRPSAASPAPPRRPEPDAEESRRPTLRVVRPALPPEPPRSPEPPPAPERPPVREAQLTLPLPTPAPRRSSVAVADPGVVQMAGRRRRRRRGSVGLALAGVGMAAALAVALIFGVWGPAPVEVAAMDAHAARIARLDRLGDTLGPALRNYGERVALYQDGLLACDGLARGYLAVDSLWGTYRTMRRGLALPLDAARQARDGRLADQVDAMRRDFVRAGCTVR